VAPTLALKSTEWQPAGKEESEKHRDETKRNLKNAVMRSKEMAEPTEEVAKGLKDEREAENEKQGTEHRAAARRLFTLLAQDASEKPQITRQKWQYARRQE